MDRAEVGKLPPMVASATYSKEVWSWSIYDLANTIFYGVVVTMYLPGHVLSLSGGAHTPYALATPPAMILGAILAPFLGEWADRRGIARKGVVVATLVNAVLCVALAFQTEVLSVLVTFSASLLAYNIALVFYNTMLPHVAGDAAMARVSGLGVGLGYLGNVIAFPLAAFVVNRADGDPRAAFVLAAVLFVAFTLPLALVCKDPKPRPREDSVARPAFGLLLQLLKRCRTERGLLLFLLGNFLCADALNAAYQWMVPFIERPEGLGIGKTIPMLLINVVAVPAAIVMGVIGDRTSPKPVMIVGAFAFLVAVAVPQLLIDAVHAGALPAALLGDGQGTAPWRVLGAGTLVIFGAIGVGGILGAARKWICRLTPVEEQGAWFGMYGLTNKLSLIGLVAFSALADWHGDYRYSIAFIAAELMLAACLLGFAPRARADFSEPAR